MYNYYCHYTNFQSSLFLFFLYIFSYVINSNFKVKFQSSPFKFTNIPYSSYNFIVIFMLLTAYIVRHLKKSFIDTENILHFVVVYQCPLDELFQINLPALVLVTYNFLTSLHYENILSHLLYKLVLMLSFYYIHLSFVVFFF